jgi:hypothetical protein
MKHEVLDSKKLTRIVNKVCEYDSSTGEFLLPVIGSKKATLNSLKKIFDGTSFLLKSVNIEKIEENFYMLLVKGKKQKIEI